MEKVDIVTAIVNVTEKLAQETMILLAQPVRVRRIRRHARKSLAIIRGLRVSLSKHPARPVRREDRAKNASHTITAENLMLASAGISQE